MNKKFYYIYIGIMAILMAACQNEEILPLEDEQGSVSYTIKLKDHVEGRAFAVGDGSYVDQLVVGVFQPRNNKLKQIGQFTFPVVDGTAMVNIPLLKKDTYDLVFWAQTENNGVYNIDDLSNITVNYGAFEKTQAESVKLDAFYAVRKEVCVTDAGSETILLNRPFTQVSFGVYGNQVDVDMIKSAEIEISGLYTQFCPLNSSEIVNANVSAPYVFKFKDLDDKENTFIINDKTYTHLTTNYFLAPTQNSDYKIRGSVKLMDMGGTTVCEFPFADVPLLPNNCVNVGKIMN